MNKTEEWKKKLTEQESCGETQASWCKKRNISMSRFRYWKRKLDSVDTHKVKFVELEGKNIAVVESVPAISLEVAGMKINVFKGTDIQLLKTVIQVVKTC